MALSTDSLVNEVSTEIVSTQMVLPVSEASDAGPSYRYGEEEAGGTFSLHATDLAPAEPQPQIESQQNEQEQSHFEADDQVDVEVEETQESEQPGRGSRRGVRRLRSHSADDSLSSRGRNNRRSHSQERGTRRRSSSIGSTSMSSRRSNSSSSRPNNGNRESGSYQTQGVTSTTMDRRNSMTDAEQRERRACIKAILADTSLTALERRRSIQFLMDGRRNAMSNNSNGGTKNQDNGTRTGTGDDGNPVTNDSNDRRLPDLDITTIPRDTEKKNDLSATATGYLMAHAHTIAHGHGRHASICTFAGPKSTGLPYCQPTPSEHAKRAELTRPKCNHYTRNCTLIAPCCGAAFGCRICHDDSPILPPLLSTLDRGRNEMRYQAHPSSGNYSTTDNTGSGSGQVNHRRKYQRSSSMPSNRGGFEVEHHTIDRFAVKEVICRNCYTRQSSKTNKCIHCNIQFGEYHCSICNLWMSSEEEPYHCADCGFCRVGGASNFKHCHDCGMCIDALLFEEHNCIVGKYMCNCPVCQEDLFSSRSASHEMPCGHAIHWHCFRELATHDSRCPVCKKTAETHERMMPTWNAMAMGIELQPIPAEYCKVVSIACNDCERRDENRSWHFLGVQCKYCQSFNTVVERIIMVGVEAFEFLRIANAVGSGIHGESSVDSGSIGGSASSVHSFGSGSIGGSASSVSGSIGGSVSINSHEYRTHDSSNINHREGDVGVGIPVAPLDRTEANTHALGTGDSQTQNVGSANNDQIYLQT